ncbi:MAG: hypothetical protein KAY24_00145 [Candidatus Eisenbacteria sp.]|nr:hypothetical protein [Candidatus Eisenbacteria bacterium]
MINIHAQLKDRQGSAILSFPNLKLVPAAYSWTALGGPDKATITAYGGKDALFQLFEHLRARVVLVDEFTRDVWWGYVDEVEVRMGNIAVGASISPMANSTAVAYSLIAVGESTPGTRATTAWVNDEASQGEYGKKELLIALGGASAVQAEQARDVVLAARKYPISTIKHVGGGGKTSATLKCLGWWHRLDWRYYANTNTTNVATATQIAAMVTAKHPWLNGTRIEDASGVNSSEYRDGDNTTLDLIRELLESGTTNNQRLLAEVTKDLYLRVWEEPARTDTIEHYLRHDGRLLNRWRDLIESHLCPVGVWVRSRAFVPGSLDTTFLVAAERFFIERAVYTIGMDRLRLQPRGVKSVWEIAEGVVAG